MKQKILFFFIALFHFSVYGQSFFEKDWKTTIDTTWEPYYSTDKMIEIYDSIWTVISNEYACFQYLDTNWDSLVQNNRIEILQGMSTGRFVAILNHFARRLKESHTFIGDVLINQNGNPKRGTPQIYQGGWGRDSHFGAALSPLPDSSLLVYCVSPNHPLGLEIGDVILGYEGVPWKVLYKTLLEMEFPFGGISLIGSNDDSETENWLKGAGNNWHLFESIDFVKYETKDTLHLPTSLLEDQEFDLYYSGQIPVKGVEFYDNKVQHPVSWGIVENTNVGYVYIWSWKEHFSSINFKNAIDSLVNILKVDGLILDVRANTGGYINNSNGGLDLLFNKSPHSFSLAARESIEDFYSLRPTSTYSLHTDTTKFFDGPIAVLSGSSSISATDFFLYRMREHPKAKIFGSTPTGSYCSAKHAGIDRIAFSYA